jgi:aryl-alcohol dehydrogenase-like predicted oxidoreductase
VSIQNPYNLLNRSYETGLAEFSHREDLSLLAYSPLAFGVLSGKYLNGARPAGARITLYDRFVRYTGPFAQEATERYVLAARKYGLEPSQVAHAFLLAQPFVTSAITGATTVAQLESNLQSIHLKLNDELIAEINAIHASRPNPIQ